MFEMEEGKGERETGSEERSEVTGGLGFFEAPDSDGEDDGGREGKVSGGETREEKGREGGREGGSWVSRQERERERERERGWWKGEWTEVKPPCVIQLLLQVMLSCKRYVGSCTQLNWHTILAFTTIPPK